MMACSSCIVCICIVISVFVFVLFSLCLSLSLYVVSRGMHLVIWWLGVVVIGRSLPVLFPKATLIEFLKIKISNSPLFQPTGNHQHCISSKRQSENFDQTFWTKSPAFKVQAIKTLKSLLDFIIFPFWELILVSKK